MKFQKGLIKKAVIKQNRHKGEDWIETSTLLERKMIKTANINYITFIQKDEYNRPCYGIRITGPTVLTLRLKDT